MSDSPDATSEAADADGPATRDLLLVALAILALLVAAFALPPLGSSAAEQGGEGPDEPVDVGEGDSDGGSSDGPGTPGDGNPGGDSDGDGRVSDGGGPASDGGSRPGDGRSFEGDGNGYTLRGSDGGAPGDGNVTVRGRDGREPYRGCLVLLWDRPVPGKAATVFVWNDARPVRDNRVWFEDRSVGRTSSLGRVDGRIPYERRLEITVRAPAAPVCRFLSLDRRVGYDEWVDRHGLAVLTVESGAGTEVEPVDGNVSAVTEVYGEARVTVSGDPYPGETVRVNATVADVPMRRATVSVDGREVGRTDVAGSYDLPIPSDGTEELTVAVARGDFEGRAIVDVLLLSVQVQPAAPVAIPGSRATVLATFGDRPAPGTTVSLGGETLGTTGTDGRLTVELPFDPRDAVVATARGQAASAAIWPLYVPLALGSLLVVGAVVGSLAASWRRGSAGSTRQVAAIWGAVAVVLAGGLLGGRRGAALAVGAVALVAVTLAVVVYRTAVRAFVGGAVRWVWGLAARVNAFALWLADVLLRFASWTGGIVRGVIDRLRALPRSLGALIGLAWSWLRCRPAQIATVVRRFLAGVRVRSRRAISMLLTPLGVGAVALVLASAGVGFVLADEEGAAAGAVAAIAVIAVVVWIRSRDVATASTGSTESNALGTSPPPAIGSGESQDSAWNPSLRDLWRLFARWVVPGRWRTRTPGEVARAAVDRGFPAGPVGQLTDAFRAVEYGGHSPSEELRDRARSAFETLRADRGEEVDEP